ncbi:hypothetical protein BU14_0422s0009 [Porphyra umbilicalis]|uniref:Uncharacterized protein n=1 Tax=Porphyra umbilicalis TaxID=2786 RepID=A0A1X6NVH1_PORUM|nr:hypothetical protein BU14_0422s0009 [Porphyra umbilicalis]|eukprot:OSX72577.1 hypothetical protein BU14_0422s0009 [Porphyra umbilicalis]
MGGGRLWLVRADFCCTWRRRPTAVPHPIDGLHRAAAGGR